ncbi:alcohol dehydrogenase [Lecanosticta acicola]|uniref:Alcohol dehydrogenase n=1 Tax=Lecanosticta acicola TaxID=111012 RepID=A0AAI8W1B0_9PEZI|nr:alcohol dehydrogenase [Lecanosticta acicola]
MAAPTHTLTTYYFDSSTQSFGTKTTEKSLGYNDVLIRTTHSGICFTDVHAKSKHCGLGHEGIGFIAAIGPAVKHFRVGDRVGWGWLHTSCGHCTTCLTGYRQYCASARGFAFSDLDQGAFGDFRILDADFVYPIPERIASEDAAPLMCAGASVFEALDAAGAKAGDRIGVVGIGGLGHIGILFAKAMGCAVTAISNSEGKVADAFALGADEFRHAARLDHGTALGGDIRDDPIPMDINILLITSNAVPDLEKLLPLLARRATIVLMTIQLEPLTIPYMPFVLPGHRLIASTEASRENHLKMLNFVAGGGGGEGVRVRPWIEKFEMSEQGVREAFERLESGKMRYRGVLVRG